MRSPRTRIFTLSSSRPVLHLATVCIAVTARIMARSEEVIGWRFECSQGRPEKLVLETRYDRNYNLWFAESLPGWQHVDGFPKAGTGAEIEHSFEPGPCGFFKILAGDGFVRIPAGSYVMGDPVDGLLNAPTHSVQVAAFEIGCFEVTKALWDSVRAWAETNSYAGIPEGWGKSADHPVQHVLWYGVVKWCNARSELEGRTPCYYTVGGNVYRSGTYNTITCNWTATGYRLPTEAEWEKAARGGAVGSRFSWGANISHDLANYYADNVYLWDISATYGYHPDYLSESAPHTAPVGRFAPNGFGLYDMAGNVFEWCWDWWNSDYYSSSPTTDPRGPATGSARVLRGGAWSNNGSYCRPAYRFWEEPGELRSDIGFRLTRSILP